jgi:glycosyltransferase involved in cell wall biosynthesis
MLYPIKVVDIELSRPIPTIEGLDGYMGLKGLVRLHGVPIGYVNAPITLGRCTAETLSKLILEQHSWAIICQLLKNGLASPQRPEDLRLEDLINLPPAEYDGELPLVTVAVCTRDRPDDIKRCLESLLRLDYPRLEILVIDNAPKTEATCYLTKTHYPQVRYIREPRPGLDWARNRAILEARGEIIAYTDDDVFVDPSWVKAIARTFIDNPKAMAVTGLVVPYELETEAQVLFEAYGGFGQGFATKRIQLNAQSADKLVDYYGTPGQFGTGANMAYRRCLFDKVGYFDPALDVGTVTNGAGDLDMFFRVVKAGHLLIYEPTALVRHRHRPDYGKLRYQLANNGVGLYAYFVKNFLAYPKLRLSFIKLGVWWLWWWLLRRLWINFKYPNRFPTDLVQAEFWGCFTGLTRYQQARKTAIEIATVFSAEPQPRHLMSPPAPQPKFLSSGAIAIRTVELSQPLQPLTNLTDYATVQVLVNWRGKPLGQITVANNEQDVNVHQLVETIVQSFGNRLLYPDRLLNPELKWAAAVEVLTDHWKEAALSSDMPEHLPNHVKVSIALATLDRPDDLRNCLHHLLKQETSRPVEIIVVDNNPSSGLTPPVVAEFPGVILVSETRKGLAYARNAGITASSGDIIIATDDDVTVFPDWLEQLVAPFSRPDVMIVTGNVLPIELETSYQQAFEAYGGLGRGFERFEVNGDWFESFPRQAVPTWRLGATANAAFRATIFSDPEMGLMEEVLGPGMPSGVGEDTYVFYKVLKAGYTLFYEPTACVWHKHRRTEEALRRQLYNYSKGGPSYHLVTWLQDGDWRGLWRILVELPYQFAWRFQARLRGWTDYPMSLLGLELVGNLAGPWSLWQSYRRVRREGRSTPYIPVSQRPQPVETQTITEVKPTVSV